MLDEILLDSIFFESYKPSGENIFEKIKLQCCSSFPKSYHKSTHGFFICRNIKNFVIIFIRQNRRIIPSTKLNQITSNFSGYFYY